ncbi:MAG: hypothetical protein J7545_08395 [Roseofilum sp. SBFL]|uniref:DUF3226 domain-containing protein n=1 Tax=unclassified Roseofilum TaxID=2620099 RepID=UPI001B0753F1|nr:MULTISPECIES: DUF3226 domain-containing protein [unclassified Roseofilum]MBP0015818.1 hypothetical protein [Roseofilum sp. SID3]MBP0022726.1 hypothetical protein [Roseofilum sp. SID2]MBP0037025.1 hypothetical protein [Roseofilum sp. SID1]MBP0041977.1 hypothetical protein [Roseofilum sp. SBFL]
MARQQKPNPKKLIVEGNEDLRVIPELIEAHGVIWEPIKNERVVEIIVADGDKKINKESISTRFKESGLTALGIIVDADQDLEGRWRSIRNFCLPSIADIPEQLPASGLIHITPENIRFGIWIMPDNQTQGMLETFLKYLVPDKSQTLWEYAQEVAQAAKKKEATFKSSHVDKANIYTWLAWQDPPGRQLHDAVKQKILDPNHPKAQDFVKWFKALYQL